MIEINPNHQVIAAQLGVRYDGIQDWGMGKKLVAFTVLEGAAKDATFYFEEWEQITLETVQGRLLKKTSEFLYGIQLACGR